MAADEPDDLSPDEAELPYAALPPGFSIRDVEEAIEQSGYPLQADVAHAVSESVERVRNLGARFQEEWTYVDSDTGQARSIDIYYALNLLRLVDGVSRIELGEGEEAPSGHSFYAYGPQMDLLIECKQSALPFIFFVRDEKPSETHNFPTFGGIPSSQVELLRPHEVGEPRPYRLVMAAHDVLGLYDLTFFKGPRRYAGSMAKVAYKGKGRGDTPGEDTRQARKIELTGEDAYRSLVLPLVKAAKHLKNLNQPPESETEDWFHRVHMIVPIAVIRAPMFASSRTEQGHDLTPVPWVRLWNLEPTLVEEKERAGSSTNYHYIDAVHESYLPKYLDTLNEDFVTAARRIESIEDVLISGRGVSVSNLTDDGQDTGDATSGEEATNERYTYEELRPLTPEEENALLDGEGNPIADGP